MWNNILNYVMNEILSWYQIELFIRLLVAALCGLLIGIEREKRSKNAGMRTHLIVATSSALMMIVSKYGFFDVLDLGMNADATRIASGVVSAIGFLGVGVIFTKHESVSGVTTAAGLWATVGIGIAVGSGLYEIAIVATILILIMQMLLHKIPLTLSNHENCVFIAKLKSIEEKRIFEEKLKQAGVRVLGVKARREADGFSLTLSVKLSGDPSIDSAMALLEIFDEVSEVKFRGY